MSRNVETLIRRVREELRAEGPDGAGYSDFFIREALNSGLAELAEFFPVRDTIEFETEEGKNQYELDEMVPDVELENIVRVLYDGRQLRGMGLDEYFEMSAPEEGTVLRWLLWGTNFILTGEVENKNLKLFVSRAPKRLTSPEDTPELPYYADEALIQYVISACYRESRDYERANYHYTIFLRQKERLASRMTPQMQREHRVGMRDSYWGPVRERRGSSRSDTNPGGQT